MRVALLTTFAASKKEPLAPMMNRVHQAFLTGGLSPPAIRFTLSDTPVAGSTSSVSRALKRYPELQRFVTDAPPAPGLPATLRISNGPDSPASGESVPYETLEAIAAGVPRTFPFRHLEPPGDGDVSSVGRRIQGHLTAAGRAGERGWSAVSDRRCGAVDPDRREPGRPGPRVGPDVRPGHRAGGRAVARGYRPES